MKAKRESMDGLNKLRKDFKNKLNDDGGDEDFNVGVENTVKKGGKEHGGRPGSLHPSASTPIVSPCV